MKTIAKLVLTVFITSLVVSCSSDDDNNLPIIPVQVNEEEVITTLTVTLSPQGGGTDITLRSQDLDGDGPNAPTVTVSGDLATNTTYNGSITLLNEMENPADDITAEVSAEGADHQFFYTATNNIATMAYNDQDANGDPIGLAFTLTTTTTGTGNLTFTLRHEPSKDAAGVSGGDIANAGGETDIEVTFTGVNVSS